MVRTVPKAHRMIRCLLAALSGAVMIATAASGQEKVKFPIGVGTKTLGTGMYWLANKKGFFDEVGLEVQLGGEMGTGCFSLKGGRRAG